MKIKCIAFGDEPMTAVVHFFVYLLEPVTLVGTIISTLAGILGLIVIYRTDND